MQTALEGYSNAMKHGETYDLRALLRIVHLWFANLHRKSVNAQMQSALEVLCRLSMTA